MSMKVYSQPISPPSPPPPSHVTYDMKNSKRQSGGVVVVGRISPSIHGIVHPSSSTVALFSQLHCHVNITWCMLAINEQVRFLANREHGYTLSQENGFQFQKYPLSVHQKYTTLPNVDDSSTLSFEHRRAWSAFCAYILCGSLYRRVLKTVKKFNSNLNQTMYVIGPLLELDSQVDGGIIITLSCMIVVEKNLFLLPAPK